MPPILNFHCFHTSPHSRNHTTTMTITAVESISDDERQREGRKQYWIACDGWFLRILWAYDIDVNRSDGRCLMTEEMSELNGGNPSFQWGRFREFEDDRGCEITD